MAEYINKEAAVNALVKIINDYDMPKDWRNGMSAAMSALYRVPAADVREVVLCKDCEMATVCSDDREMYCTLNHCYRGKTYFCADGRWKNENHN